jgi:hypothetical protein
MSNESHRLDAYFYMSESTFLYACKTDDRQYQPSADMRTRQAYEQNFLRYFPALWKRSDSVHVVVTHQKALEHKVRSQEEHQRRLADEMKAQNKVGCTVTGRACVCDK